MLFVIEVHRRASVVLLEEAKALEAMTGTTSTTEAMYAMMSGRRCSAQAMGHPALLGAVGCHTTLVLGLALVAGWTLTGN